MPHSKILSQEKTSLTRQYPARAYTTLVVLVSYCCENNLWYWTRSNKYLQITGNRWFFNHTHSNFKNFMDLISTMTRICFYSEVGIMVCTLKCSKNALYSKLYFFRYNNCSYILMGLRITYPHYNLKDTIKYELKWKEGQNYNFCPALT